MKFEFKHSIENRFLLLTGLETIILGMYFVTRSFVFMRPDFLNTLASHVDDPPFATFLIVIGAFCTFTALFDIQPMIRWCYGIAEFIWTVYALAFLLQDIEFNGHIGIATWLMFFIAIRTLFESWAGDDE